MLGDFKVSELTTAQLRRWHNLVREEVGAHTANRVMSMLKGILALAEEDFGVRVCSFPTNLAKRKAKPKKDILIPEEVARAGFAGFASSLDTGISAPNHLATKIYINCIGAICVQLHQCGRWSIQRSQSQVCAQQLW
jgi:hypothetical protein